METYDVAAKNGKVRGIIGMTFLDQRNQDVQYTTTRNWFMGHVTTPMLPGFVSLGLGRMKVRMNTASKMSALCNNPEAQAAFMRDKTSAANSSSLAFLNSYMHHDLIVEAADFDVCPILLTQPAEDRWTPYRLSQHHLEQVKKVPVEVKMLRHGGHYPVEPTALDDLHSAALAFINKYAAKEMNA